MSTYLIHTYEWYLIYLSCRWKKSNKLLFFPNDWDRKPQIYWTTYLQTRMIGNGAPAQKPNRSITCNSLATRLPVWFPDWPSCLFIKYYCAPHSCPFRLLSLKPQIYPSVNMWQIYNELATCLYTHVIVTKLPIYPHKLFLAILHG